MFPMASEDPACRGVPIFQNHEAGQSSIYFVLHKTPLQYLRAIWALATATCTILPHRDLPEGSFKLKVEPHSCCFAENLRALLVGLRSRMTCVTVADMPVDSLQGRHKDEAGADADVFKTRRLAWTGMSGWRFLHHFEDDDHKQTWQLVN